MAAVAATNGNELPPIRTKIVATIGPASRTPAALRRLIDAGVNVFRLNFSHGTHEEHAAVLADIRAVSREAGRHVGVLQDLCGPKVRLGAIPGDSVECPLGEEFTLVTDRSSDSPRELTCSYRELPNDLEPGETVLFADGTVSMTVTDTAPGRARLKVTLPGRLRSRQGLNVPGSELAVESLTDKDLHDLDWTASHAGDVQFVGLSFARSPDDVAWLRRELQARKCPARVVVKIEKPQAVRQLEAIVAATDGLMVARGDLGVEMDVQRVPAVQKRAIGLCNQAHRPVITATQMLNSMEHSSRPTRAEASDVFNAVLDGTDAVMLSGETAVGEYPVEAVATMRQICAEAEAYQKKSGARPAHGGSASLAGLVEPITEATVDAACLVAERLDAPLIVVATDSGRTALALSNRRPPATILALARAEHVARLLAVCWGVTAVVQPDGSAEKDLSFAMEWARSRRLVLPGQHVVLVRGQMPGEPRSRGVLAREVE
jgi:pyruvate kinase